MRYALTLSKYRLLRAVSRVLYFRFHILIFALYYMKPAEAVQTRKTVWDETHAAAEEQKY